MRKEYTLSSIKKQKKRKKKPSKEEKHSNFPLITKKLIFIFQKRLLKN